MNVPTRPPRAAWRPIDSPMLIDGAAVKGREAIQVFNPARPREVVGTVARGTPADVAAAVAAARQAQKAWGETSFAARADALSCALRGLSDGLEERAEILVRENGKTLAEARGELASVPKRQQLTLDLAPQLDAGRTLDGPHGSTIVSCRPYGVVTSIVPWNAPISLSFGQLVPALLAGNAVVLKPPETAPLALSLSVRLLAAALPRGLVNIVTGLPEEIGDELTTNPDVSKIAFTGSIPAARKIMANAAGTIKSVTFELGGNDPAIVLPDVDLSQPAMDRMAHAVFRMSGQICMAIKRIYVSEEVETRFMEAFGAAVDRYVVGDGLHDGVTMGPLHTARALERARALVEDARGRGARVSSFGQVRRDDVAEGHFMAPTVVAGLADDAPLMTQEQFCPALPVTTFRDVDDAVDRANASVFGLGASVWGADPGRAAGIARRLQAGTVFVNTHGTEAIDRRAPYGGVKQSGIGRKAGLEGVLEYGELQTLATFG